MQDLTIVIPYFNGKQYIDNLLISIPKEIPVIIVDDLSSEPLQIKSENVSVFRLDKKGYFTGAVNFGIEHCETDVLILNQDVVLSDGWQDVINDNRKTFDLIGERIKGNHPMFPNGYVHGTFMYINRRLIDDIGLLNSELYPLWGSTAEFQLRASRKGYKVLPLEEVKGFNHLRNGNFGSSIKATIEKEKHLKSVLINTPPEISVIIPCYNFGKYLPDAINSLIGGETCLGKMPGQTFQSFEIIIVDDGSDQKTQDVIKSFVDGWNGIRAIRIERNPVDKNGKYIGKPLALNTGISKAIGKYITILDADDLMDSRRLNILYKTAVKNPHSVIFDDLTAFKDGKFLKHWGLPEYDFETLIYKNGMHIGIFYPKEAWVKVGGYPKMDYGREDWAFNVALGIEGYCGVRVSQPYYLYRREGQNRTLENTKPHWQEKFRKQMRELYPELYRGERKMGCCGKGKPKNQNLNNNRAVGQQMTYKRALNSNSQPDGMVYVEYTGPRIASFTIWGSQTNPRQPYRVNPKTPVFLVYEIDLYTERRNSPGILDIVENGKNVFQIYNPPVKKETVVEEVLVADYSDEESYAEEEEAVVEELNVLNDALQSIRVLDEFLYNSAYTTEDLNYMLEQENQSEKPRKGVLERLEAAINEYDGTRAVIN